MPLSPLTTQCAQITEWADGFVAAVADEDVEEQARILEEVSTHRVWVGFVIAVAKYKAGSAEPEEEARWGTT